MSLSCVERFEERFTRCTLDVELDPVAAAPGEVVTAFGGPWTEVPDTRVEVAGLRATVLGIDRSSECARCADCREDAGCDDCRACEACLDACADCVEALTFEVPAEAPAGRTGVTVFNRQGGSRPAPFTVLGNDDTDTDSDTDTDTDSDTDLPE